MSQKTLENAVRSDPHCKALLDEFITKASANKIGEPGAFTRAVRNSSRLKVMLGKAIADSVQEVARCFDSKIPDVVTTGASVMPSSAPQRFDSMLVALQRFVWNAPGCIRFLIQEAASKTDTSQWASDFLEFLLKRNGEAGPQNLLLLALLAEFVEASSRFVRQQEAGKSDAFHIAHTASQLEALEVRLADLFDVEKDGSPRMPRALSKTYTHGYVLIIRGSLMLNSSSALVAAGKVAFYLPGGEESVQDWALAELGSVLNIKKVFLATLHAEIDHGVALALRPFDVVSWAKTHQELGPTLKPLAEAVKVPLADLCTQFESAWPAALTLSSRCDDIGQIWAKVLAEAGRRIERLGALKRVVVLMLAAFPGSGEVECNFSILQGMSSHRRAGVKIDVLRACIKVAIDGPKIDDFVGLKDGQCHHTPLSKLAQNWYFTKYGGKKFSRPESDVKFATARRGQQKVGSMSHAIAERSRELLTPAVDEPMGEAAVASVKRSMSERWSEGQEQKFAGAADQSAKKQKQWGIDAEPFDEAIGRSRLGFRSASRHARVPLGHPVAAAPRP